MVKYRTENSVEFWRARGVDKAKLKPKDEFTAVYEKMFLEKGDIRFQGFSGIAFRKPPLEISYCRRSNLNFGRVMAELECGFFRGIF